MLQMLRASSCVHAEQCKLSTYSLRCLLIMNTLKSSFYFLALAAVGMQAFAQPGSEPARSAAKAGPAARPQASEPQRAPERKDPRPDSAADQRAKRGSDLRLALVPQTSNSKAQGGLANVADVSTPEALPEHHLNAKERQEMRELLRQQRLKLQAGPQN